MSGTPKYSQATLRAEQEQRLADERRRAAEREAAARAARAEARRQREAAAARRAAEQAARAWAKAQEEAVAAVGEARAVIEGLEGDPVVAAWGSAALARIRQEAAGLDALLKAEDWAGVRRVASAVQTRSDAAISACQARQLQEDRRRYIVGGILAVLQRQGFQVGQPGLTRANDLDSDVVIRASRDNRRHVVDIQVPVDARVRYELDGYERKVEATSDGSPAATCDAAEDTLVALHAQLADDLGIEMGEVVWEGKNPKRIRKGAKELPTGGAPARTRTVR